MHTSAGPLPGSPTEIRRLSTGTCSTRRSHVTESGSERRMCSTHLTLEKQALHLCHDPDADWAFLPTPRCLDLGTGDRRDRSFLA